MLGSCRFLVILNHMMLYGEEKNGRFNGNAQIDNDERLDLFTFSLWWKVLRKDLLLSLPYDKIKIDGWLLGALLIIMVLNFQLLYPWRQTKKKMERKKEKAIQLALGDWSS